VASRTTLLKWIGYPVYFLFCMVCFTYCTFPYERVREKVRVAIEESFNADVQIAELSPSWVTGVKVTGVEIKTRPTRMGEVPKTFQIDALTARVGLLSLLTGGIDLSYAVEIYGGEIDGTFEQDGTNASVAIQFQDLDLSKVQTLREAIGLPLAGRVTGDATLALPEQMLSKSDGSIRLLASGVRVGDGHAKLEIPGFGGLTIDPIEVGDLHAELLVKAGKANITRLGAQGKDLELIGEGKMDLRDPVPLSNISAYIRFKISPAYTRRNKRMEPLVGGLDLMPTTKRAKRPDGFFGYRISGTFSRGLSFLPSARPPLARERAPRERSPVRHRVPRPRDTGLTGPPSPGVPSSDSADEDPGGILDPAIAGPPAPTDEQDIVAP
jgi:type II secretion system protein N